MQKSLSVCHSQKSTENTTNWGNNTLNDIGTTDIWLDHKLWKIQPRKVKTGWETLATVGPPKNWI